MLKVRKYGWRNCVYSCPELGFGDTWAASSYLARISEELKMPVKVRSTNNTFKSRINSIIPNLKTNGKVQFVDEPIKVGINYCEMFSATFLPTKNIWHQNDSKLIAYQFDGFHLGYQKNLTNGALNHLIEGLNSRGYSLLDVGHKKSIEYIVDVLSRCEFFVGCPSGLSIACMSVRTPIYLITSKLEDAFVKFLLDCQYKTKPDIRVSRTVKDFFSLIDKKLKLY